MGIKISKRRIRGEMKYVVESVVETSFGSQPAVNFIAEVDTLEEAKTIAMEVIRIHSIPTNPSNPDDSDDNI